MPDGDNPITRIEGRWVAFLTAIALAFGGIWLQNQYQATLRLQEQMITLTGTFDDRYVHKDLFETMTARLDRIDKKLDTILSEERKNNNEPRELFR